MDTTKDPLLIAAAVAALILLLLFAGFLVIITRFQKKAFYLRNKAALAKLEVLEKERDRMARCRRPFISVSSKLEFFV